jgi:hypothetical protein
MESSKNLWSKTETKKEKHTMSNTDDGRLARDPRKPLPTPVIMAALPQGTMYAAGARFGGDLNGHYVCVKPTMSQPPAAAGQSNDCWAWSVTAAVADVAQTPLAKQ